MARKAQTAASDRSRTPPRRRIEEVAKLAGVAPITVSRALNHPQTVSEATRNVILAAVDQIGYIPNRVAGGLASNRSRTIGIVLPHIGNSTFFERVQGMTEALEPRGYNLLIALTDYSPEMELRHVMSFLGQRVAGLSLTGTAHLDRVRQLLGQAEIPVVETSNVDGRPIDMLVGYSNEKATFAMVEHLSRCGYRKIGMISTPAAFNDRSAGRQAGYRAAVSAFGLVEDPSLVLETPSGFAEGAAAFVEMLSRHPSLDAVMCSNDILAIGCMLEARRRSISIPDDLGITGFDDIELGQQFVPALTTVNVPRHQIGTICAQLLLERLDRPQTPPRTVDLGFRIVPRGSTRPPIGE
ncbi:MAG: LacI family DNA-binding transcriptional regulator [Burkholderiaceae bacterium]